MSHPHASQEDRDALDDHGLVFDDNTPDMRKAPVAAEALQKNNHPTITEIQEGQS